MDPPASWFQISLLTASRASLSVVGGAEVVARPRSESRRTISTAEPRRAGTALMLRWMPTSSVIWCCG